MTTYLLFDGTEVTETPASNYLYKIIGKIVKTPTQLRFYVSLINGSLVDNRTIGVNTLQRENSLPTYKQVSNELYEKYRKYSQNGKSNVTINSIERLL